jgi:hypothetical protein
MLTRRTFTMLGTALVSAMACRPSWAARAFAVDLDGLVSPRMIALGDSWEEAGRSYEVLRDAAAGFSCDAPALIAIRDATRAMLAAADYIFLEPSRTRGDVLLKYHVMDELGGRRTVHDSDCIMAAGGAQWHRIVEQEAEAFGLDLNYFWLWEMPPYAKIDGERNSPKWAAVSRWRTERYAS